MTVQTEISTKEREEIHAILKEDYKDDEIVTMLDAATFEKDDDGVTVTYDNGVQDYFEFQKVLVHSHNMKPFKP